MQGHAGYADGGADIVCAAASALCCTLAGRLSYKQITGGLVMTHCRLSAGEADIGARPVGDWKEVQEVFETICTGFAMLCGEYPKHIFLTERTVSGLGEPEIQTADKRGWKSGRQMSAAGGRRETAPGAYRKRDGGQEDSDAVQGAAAAGNAQPEKVGGKRKTHSL